MVRSDDVRLRLFIGYTVTAVWATSFMVAMLRPPQNASLYLSVQAVMLLVAGSVFTSALVSRPPAQSEPEPVPAPKPRPRPRAKPKPKPEESSPS